MDKNVNTGKFAAGQRIICLHVEMMQSRSSIAGFSCRIKLFRVGLHSGDRR